ncbi:MULTISPECIES: type II secretion system F family protein [Salinivibrio]|uniref:Biotin synthase n=1 Tax=Salinivibrio kushneri TaxID=1908198 RepID=A0AB36JUQ7_9GAMM|nr:MULTISPECIES: type II secretion system F family protein [Salinivibrio]ODP97621.1 biotin synthase [Salinivibrio sp. BNH]OOE37681.1 biotin synthase [Salinivibrio kushneri]OOE38883.1 biotin synthase [Salinivibrio kushneri]OOE52362.1 biotin synthase [Salinivibrio kushneri]QCP02809.1 type II secretion system F family protein [Salinivibrio kushneri]
MSQQQWLFLALILIGCVIALRGLRHSMKQKRFREFSVNSADERKFDFWERVGTALSQLVSSDKQDMEQKFLAAGIYDTRLSKLFMPAKYMLLIVGASAIYLIGQWQQWPSKWLFIVEILWLVVTIIGPDAYLGIRKKALVKSISNKLPYMLDLMAVCVQTGMTIEASITYLSREMAAFDRDLSFLLTRVNERSRIVGLEQALEELYMRVPSNEMRSFVMTLNQSLQYGTSIYGVLTTLSSDIREVQLLRIEEKIGQLAAKMSIPLIVFIMVPIVILIAAPGIMRMLANA